MNGNGGLIIIAALGFGVLVWLILRNSGGTVVQPPCTVGGSYGGYGINLTCSEAEKIYNGVKGQLVALWKWEYGVAKEVVTTLGRTTSDVVTGAGHGVVVGVKGVGSGIEAGVKGVGSGVAAGGKAVGSAAKSVYSNTLGRIF